MSKFLVILKAKIETIVENVWPTKPFRKDHPQEEKEFGPRNSVNKKPKNNK